MMVKNVLVLFFISFFAFTASKSQKCEATFNREKLAFNACLTLEDGALRVFWNIVDDKLESMIIGKTSGYLGFGWGYPKMVPGNAVVAYRTDNGSVKVDDYALDGYYNTEVTVQRKQQLSNVDAESQGEQIAARFTRPLTGIQGVPDLSGEVKYIFAMGGVPKSPPSLGLHKTYGQGTTSLLIPIENVKNNTGRRNYYLIHGILMVFAWVVLIPILVLMMHFGNKDLPATFQRHRLLSMTGVLIGAIAFFMAFMRGVHTFRTHRMIGILVITISIIQVATGSLRPEKQAANRKSWRLLHVVLGCSVIVLAIANIIIGFFIFATRKF